MASKFGLAGGIPERRVRPIWDAIDSRQFKNALKLSASLLSKYPNSPYALALKALVLERMGKSDEALSICLNAKDLLYKNDPLLMDDLTLSTLQIVFQRLDHLELATSCYEHACSKFPNNMELMMGLFNCYVREYSFVKQQQVAIKMYKLVGEERFLLWAVCSIQLQFLQVLCGNGGEKLLLLAEGLLRKHISSHSLHEPEAIIVYISILEQQAKYGDALEILSGKLGSLLMIEVDKLRIQGRLLARSGDYVSGAKIYQKILELSPDDWECFLHYLGCLLEDDSSWSHGANDDPIHPLQSTDCKVSDEVFDSRLSEASAFVQKLQSNADDGYIRCPYLATLEIVRRKHFCGKASYDDLIEALMHYFSKFGHLACFTSDVEVFVEVLTPDKRIEFVGKLAEISDPPAPITTKVLGSSITIFRMKQLMGNISKPPITELEGSSRQMVEMYWKSLPLSKDLDPQESMHGEELLSMACNALVQLFCQTRNLGYLIEAIMVLEFGLTIRRYVWQHKILLLHLYANLGALSLVYEWYKTLDVKNILMETVSHHIIYHMLSSPLWANLSNLLQDYLRFMDDHFRESADLTFLAYRHRNYSKVIEFVQFKEKLQQSNQYLVARVETSILQLKQKANNIEEEEGVLEGLNCGIHFVEVSNEIRSKNLNFNEDFQTRPWWTPIPEKNYLLGPFEGISYCPKDVKKDREEIVRRGIERKSLLPRLIYLSIQSSSVSHKENSEVNGSAFDPKVSSELKFLLEQYAKMLGSSFTDAIEVIKGVSTGEKSCEAFGSDMIDWLNFSVFLNAWNLNTRELSPSSGDRGIWNMVDTLLRKCITGKAKSVSSLIHPPSHDFPMLVQMVTEPLAWHGLILQSCTRSTLPSGKKKKKAAPSDNSSTALTALRDSIESSLGVVEEVAKSLTAQVKKPEDETVDAILSLVGNDKADEGPGQVLRVIESSRGSADEAQLGSRIFEAVKSWSPADMARKMGNGTKAVFSEFLHICDSKVKLFRTLNQQLSTV